MRTRLKEIRGARGFSAADLAGRIGVSRQTIHAIEDGKFVPNTSISLQLARELQVAVEDIFSISDEAAVAPVGARLLSDEPVKEGQLVRLCRVNERMAAVPVSYVPAYLPATDGVVVAGSKQTVSVRSPIDVPDNGKRLLIAGCDPALSLLNELLFATGLEVINVPSSSQCALKWLKQGMVHVAGSHLLDHATGDYNVPMIRRLFPAGSVGVVTFAMWEQGIVVRHGNPKSIRSIADLGRKDVVLMNREKGSGSRDLLDNGLKLAGIPAERVTGYDYVARGHLAAAYSVESGSADCCIAPRSAAHCFGLDFAPIAMERFDLAFSETFLQLTAAKTLLDILNRSSLRKKLQTIAGYDTVHTGEVLV